jgi:methylenetetrahydrofolate dehydrogenase (NADP+)/methenyltetrahydrofolate cyclohydrolase
MHSQVNHLCIFSKRSFFFFMPAQLLDGVALSKKIRTEITARAAIVTAKGTRPGLAVIVVGDNPASTVYVRNKVKACEEVGFHSVLERYEEEMNEEALLARIATLNADPAIHGILVQLPLPAHIASERVLEAIAPQKDVDGFHVANAGALMVGAPEFKPCTPYGCMKLLESIEYPLRGARAVVVGASNIVGKPMAMLLLQAGATVTICNSKTRDLAHHTKDADVLVVATGKPKMITGDMVKTGSVVIDVGINRLPDGKLCGDVDFDTAKYIAGWITPVPGGVGPMTITMLLMNTLEAAEKASKH